MRGRKLRISLYQCKYDVSGEAREERGLGFQSIVNTELDLIDWKIARNSTREHANRNIVCISGDLQFDKHLFVIFI